MKICPYCNNQLHDSASFCLYCMEQLDDTAEVKISDCNTKSNRLSETINMLSCLFSAIVLIVLILRDGGK